MNYRSMLYRLKRRLLKQGQPSSFLASFLVFSMAIGLASWLLFSTATIAQTTSPQEALPPLKSHPLPPTLAQWQPNSQDDYFSAIQAIEVGYLVWAQFPVKVYVQPVDQSASPPNQFEHDRAQAWVAAVRQAVQDWTAYLPLAIVTSPTGADIQVLRVVPPLQSSNPATPPRVRSAETRYELLVDRPPNAPARLSHRFTVKLSPTQTPAYTLATARHELGHAIGIWGHSPNATDVMYFSQVVNPPAISQRDINTLKRIYEQPTRLEWSVAQQ